MLSNTKYEYSLQCAIRYIDTFLRGTRVDFFWNEMGSSSLIPFLFSVRHFRFLGRFSRPRGVAVIVILVADACFQQMHAFVGGLFSFLKGEQEATAGLLVLPCLFRCSIFRFSVVVVLHRFCFVLSVWPKFGEMRCTCGVSCGFLLLVVLMLNTTFSLVPSFCVCESFVPVWCLLALMVLL